MPDRFRLGRCVALIAVSLLMESGVRAPAASLDLEGMVVCGVPPTEAAAYTKRHERVVSARNRTEVRWSAVGPDSRNRSRHYRDERKALADVTTSVHPGIEPTRVCDITTESGETYKFWRLHRDLDQPYVKPPPRKTVHHVLYRGLKRTGRVLAFTAKVYFLAGQAIVQSPVRFLKHPYVVLFMPAAPLLFVLVRCGCGHGLGQYGEHDVRQQITAQEFTFSYAR